MLTSVGAFPVPVLTGVPVESYFEGPPLSGILLTGGNDIGAFSDDEDTRLRDELEDSLLDLALEHRVPVLGVCRGCQFLAHRYGGKLDRRPGHVAVRHPVEVTGAAGAGGWTPAPRPEVNSYHAVVIAEAPAEARVLARAPDGTIEAFSVAEDWITGLMWHPEREPSWHPDDLHGLKSLFGLADEDDE